MAANLHHEPVPPGHHPVLRAILGWAIEPRRPQRSWMTRDDTGDWVGAGAVRRETEASAIGWAAATPWTDANAVTPALLDRLKAEARQLGATELRTAVRVSAEHNVMPVLRDQGFAIHTTMQKFREPIAASRALSEPLVDRLTRRGTIPAAVTRVHQADVPITAAAALLGDTFGPEPRDRVRLAGRSGFVQGEQLHGLIHQEALVAVSFGRIDGRDYHLDHLAVAPAFRSRGDRGQRRIAWAHLLLKQHLAEYLLDGGHADHTVFSADETMPDTLAYARRTGATRTGVEHTHRCDLGAT